MSNADHHPAAAELEAFALGRLDETVLEAVARHLETCPECQGGVDRVPGDPFVTLLQSARMVPDTPPAEPLQETQAGTPVPAADERTAAWSGTNGGTERPPEVLTGKLRYPLVGHLAQYLPDGKQILVVRDAEVALHDAATGERRRVVCDPERLVFSACISPGGKWLATQQRPESVVLWNLADGRRLREWPGFRGWNFSADGDHFMIRLPAEQQDRTCSLPDLKEVVLDEGLRGFDGVHVQPGGRYVVGREWQEIGADWWVVDSGGRKLHPLVPRARGKLHWYIPWVHDRDGLVCLDDGTVRLFDLLTQREHARYLLPDRDTPLRADVSADGRPACVMIMKRQVLLLRLPARVP
jgi:hypothetical protein